MQHPVKLTVLFLSLLLALGGFWFWMAMPKSLPALPQDTKLQCLSYAPFGKNESPYDFNKGLTLSKERMDKDLELLARTTDCIRTYSSLGLEEIPELARKHGLTMWLGAWVSRDPVSTRQELQKAITLAKEYADVVTMVIVGNEVLLRREMSGAQLASYIKQVKQALPHTTVTYADVWEFWNQHPAIVPEVDAMTIHLLPYWEDEPIGVTQALLHVKEIYEQMAHAHPHKQIIIGETGWPSQGRMREEAKPSPHTQAMFVRGFVHMAHQEGWNYNIIEAIDQPWKRKNEGAVGGYWGIFDADRLDKQVLHGEVSEYPHAIWLFLGSLGLALLGCLTLLRNPIGSSLRWVGLFGVLFGGAVGLAWQAQVYWSGYWNLFQHTTGALTLGVALVLWLQVVGFVATKRAPSTPSMHKAIGVLTRALAPQMATKEDFVHLLAVSLVLMGAIRLAWDGRYLDFELGTFGIIAFAYAVFFKTTTTFAPSRLEKISGAFLFLLALKVLVNETPSNTHALVWVACVGTLGAVLWSREGRFEGLLWPFLALLGSGAVFFFLKEYVYVNESLVETCALAPDAPICLTHAWLGKMVYLNIAGWSGLLLALLGIVFNRFALALSAMILGLFCLLMFNGAFGAMLLVLGWWVVGKEEA